MYKIVVSEFILEIEDSPGQTQSKKYKINNFGYVDSLKNNKTGIVKVNSKNDESDICLHDNEGAEKTNFTIKFDPSSSSFYINNSRSETSSFIKISKPTEILCPNNIFTIGSSNFVINLFSGSNITGNF